MAFSMDALAGAAADNTFEIGAFDAKTYFSELLRKVQGGAVFNISKNGRQVAVLQGVQTAKNAAALEAHKRIMARAKRMADLCSKSGLAAVTASELKELKDAGRKH